VGTPARVVEVPTRSANDPTSDGGPAIAEARVAFARTIADVQPRALVPTLALLALLSVGCHRGKASGADAGATSTASASPAASSDPDAADVTTHASPSWAEEAGAIVTTAAGVVDGAALRARHRARLVKDTSPVVLLQGSDTKAAGGPAFDLGKRLCEAVVPVRPSTTPILLKPNMGGFEWFKDPDKSGGDDGLKGRTTDPEFVRGVIRCLHARGHDHVTVAEGWGATHADWEKLVRVSGYAKMAAEEHVPLVAMDDDGVFDVQGDQPGKPLAITGMETTHVPTLLVPRILAETLDHGLFISLPKIKAHRYGVFSLAIKGMQGTVDLSDAAPAFHQKWRMHKEMVPLVKTGKMERGAYVASIETFAERIADVLEIEAPDVVLAEGAPAMEGDGFEQLWPSRERFAIGGTNPILVDRVGAQMLGLWDNADLARELGGHKTSPLLETAARRFGVDIAAPTVTGDGAGLLAGPRPVHFLGMAGFAIHSDASPPLLPAQLGALGASAAPVERPVAHAAALGTDTITLDGKADDAAWARAKPVTWDTDYAAIPTGVTTRARFVHASSGLYVLFELEGAGLDTDRSRPITEPRLKLYDEDCVELFFTPDPAKPRKYFETELGPFGHFLDVAVDLDAGGGGDTTWSSGAHIATTQNETAHTATIEAELTAPEIVAALVSGAKLPFALYRMEGKKPRQYLAWSPPRTPRPNFHVPSAFGSLVIDP
jgi:uncharacterized protein (DUF362 family)